MKYVNYFILCILLLVFLPLSLKAETSGTATTTLTLSVCGNALVDDGEQCDVPGEIGSYSTNIAGRQCSTVCLWGAYCGDGVLQTSFAEECDDGNNDNGDFCSAICKVEPAGSGGGGSSGGGSSGSGGSQVPLGDTIIKVNGLAYPGRTVNILLDTQTVGTVRANNAGRFEFSTAASPGTASLSFWSTDIKDTRSITLNTTFDVTQGAVTNISGIILPPTIRVVTQNVNPGDLINVSGQSIPSSNIELHLDNSDLIFKTVSDTEGLWDILLDTGTLKISEHTLRARSISGTVPITTQSSFSSALQLFVGVDGQTTTPSDLNRDGKVNLIDFSILIFWWGTDGGNSSPSADINLNGKVGIEDFSILLFNWTG